MIPLCEYSRRDAHIDALLEKHRKALLLHYEREEMTLADFSAFRIYFEALVRSIPRIVKRWLLKGVVFRTNDALGEHKWPVNFASARVEEIGPVMDFPVVESPALILNDCASIGMFSAWTPSKRLRIHLPCRRHLWSVMIFFVLDLYEIEMLPLRKESLRAMIVRLRRWREIIEMTRMFLKHAVFRRPIDIAQLYSVAALRG